MDFKRWWTELCFVRAMCAVKFYFLGWRSSIAKGLKLWEPAIFNHIRLVLMEKADVSFFPPLF